MAVATKRLVIVVLVVFCTTLLALLAIGSAVVTEQTNKDTTNDSRRAAQIRKRSLVTDLWRDAAQMLQENNRTGEMHDESAAAAAGDAPLAPSAAASAATAKRETATPTPFDVASFVPKHAYSRNMWAAITRAMTAPATTVVPMVITPMFHDGDVLPRMLESINVPVRHFHFVWNSNDHDIGLMMEEFKRFPVGVTTSHNPSNFGFSASINLGLRVGLNMTREECPWFWVINCDVTFPEQTMPEMVKRMYEADLDKIGMTYGPAIDHYAFIVTRAAVEKAGLMDENFYPAYFEDVDWRWRINLAGFEEIVFHLPVNHIRSHNLKKGADPQFMAMHHRHGNGWPYGAMKWGEIRQSHIHERYPPSGWKTPFGIDMPLDLWVIDKDRMHCLKTGQGTFHPRTGHCWYNGFKTLSPVLKPNTWFPECMKNPYPDAFQPR